MYDVNWLARWQYKYHEKYVQTYSLPWGQMTNIRTSSEQNRTARVSVHDEIINASPSASPTIITGPIYPLYVYDCNRPIAHLLRQRWCSLIYDVYWLARWQLFLWGSKYLEHIPGSGLNIFRIIWILNNTVEQRITEQSTEQKSNNK